MRSDVRNGAIGLTNRVDTLARGAHTAFVPPVAASGGPVQSPAKAGLCVIGNSLR